MAHIIKRKYVLKATFAEDVSDQVGTMVTGNTETGITIAYQDSDNTLDFAVTYASASDQETATSTTTAVNPSIQHRHPSAAKFWVYATVSGGTPSIAVSYNVTSLTDNGVGDLTVTIATDFSGANWSPYGALVDGSVFRGFQLASVAAGSVRGYSITYSTLTGGDPGAWTMGGFGDQ